MGRPATERMMSPGFRPAWAAGDPPTTPSSRARTEVPKSGRRPTWPMSYFDSAFGVTVRNTALPPRSTSTPRASRAFIANTKRASRQRGVAWPSIDTIRSPGWKPAAAPGEPASTTRTTGGSSSYAATFVPTAKTVECRTTASTRFIAGPASSTSARCQRLPTGGASCEVPSVTVDSSGPRPITRT